jgi:hypothetical protein
MSLLRQTRDPQLGAFLTFPPSSPIPPPILLHEAPHVVCSSLHSNCIRLPIFITQCLPLSPSPSSVSSLPSDRAAALKVTQKKERIKELARECNFATLLDQYGKKGVEAGKKYIGMAAAGWEAKVST